MKHYVSETGEVFAYEADGSQDAFIKEGLRLLSDEELAEVRAKQSADTAPTHEQLIQAANDHRDSLLSLAAIRISPLQYAVDLDEATSYEVAYLRQWKQYCVAVNRVPSQTGYPLNVTWPEQPS